MSVISGSPLLSAPITLYAGFKVDVWPRIWSLSTQTDGNHRKVSVLLNRRRGKAGGNCELRAILFGPLCKRQCWDPDRMDGVVTTAVYCMLRSHMVSIPVDIAELCMPNMITVNVNWGLQQNSEQATLLLVLCYATVRKHKNQTDSEIWLLPETCSWFFSLEIRGRYLKVTRA